MHSRTVSTGCSEREVDGFCRQVGTFLKMVKQSTHLDLIEYIPGC